MLTFLMLPSHLNWDDKDDDLEEFCMEILRFNLDNSPGLFLEIIDEKHYKYMLDEYNMNKIKKRTRYNTGITFCDTPWGQLLSNPQILIPESYFARQFQRRFRLPYPLFLQLVEDAKEFNIFNLDNPYSTRLKIPIEMKCMAALRMLGRDLCCDDVFELSHIPLSTCNRIYRQFIQGMAEKVYSKYVYIPEGSELQSILNMYQK